MKHESPGGIAGAFGLYIFKEEISMKNNNTSGGIGFWGVLGVAFIVLKLTGVIQWSWWLVLAPLWGPFALAVVIVIITCVLCKLSD